MTITTLAEITDEDCEAFGEVVEVSVNLGDIEISELVIFLETCGYKVNEEWFADDLDLVDQGRLDEIIAKFKEANWQEREEIHKRVTDDKRI